MDAQTLKRTFLHSRSVRLRCFKRPGVFFGLPSSVRIPNLSAKASKTTRSLKGFKGVLSLNRKTLRASSETLTYPRPEPPVTIGSGHPLWPTIRAMLFFVWTFIVSIPICSTMCVLFPLMLWLDPFKRGVYCAMNSIWGTVSSWPFYQVEIEGRENLPSRKEAAVYVSNHQSYLDIFALLFLNRPFKFISKASIFKVPFVGWSMFFTGHIKLHRMDRRSQLQCLRDCQTLLSNGGSVLVFPEGTRSNNSEVQTFKKGAFSVAVNTGVPVVPITVSGSGALMRKASPLEFYSGKVKIKIHPRIQTEGLDAGVLCKRVREIIASAV